jgi:alkyl sulfatase BDS1-like metallo-beta-lactamase superfamily hydrolase
MRAALLSLLVVMPAFAAPPNFATTAANAKLAASLDFTDRQDFEFAARGFIASSPDPVVKDASGSVLRDFREDAQFSGPAPATVNPSLWRNAALVAKHGLFKVMDGIWQIRGFDLSVMTLIAGNSGWIIVDPLTTGEMAAAGLALANKQLGTRPVTAIIYTHSHADHFGGAAGVLGGIAKDAVSVPIYAPEGFMDHAVAENVIAGGAMSRRADYMFGQLLPRGAEGQVSSGLGAVRAGGTVGLLPPTRQITPETLVQSIDGIAFEFQLTPDTEAPAEMNFYLPGLRALCMAENANGAMHNLLTPRGAVVRDAKGWAKQLLMSRRAYAAKSDVMFTSHFWPRWGSSEIDRYLLEHAQAYAFVHNESVRLLNKGLDASEIAETIALPPALAKRWFNRGHYGSLKFNARAVYQRYLGAFNGDPATLDPLPRDVQARKWVEALGGPARTLDLARKAATAGEDRWAATLFSQLVRAGGDQAAREGLAASFDQLAIQAESAVWRNFYLSGAQELRGGINPVRVPGTNRLGANLRVADVLDAMSVRVLPERALGTPFTVAIVSPDAGERHLISIGNGVMLHERTAEQPADATLTVPRLGLIGLVGGQVMPAALMAAGQMQISGNPAVLQRLLGLFEAPAPGFPLVTPLP